MTVSPWNIEIARVAKQVAFDVVGFGFLYFIVLAASWRSSPGWLRVGGTGVFVLLTLFCLRKTPEILAASLVADAKARTKASEASDACAKPPRWSFSAEASTPPKSSVG